MKKLSVVNINPGTVFTTFIFIVTYKLAESVGVFVTGKPFPPRSM